MSALIAMLVVAALVCGYQLVHSDWWRNGGRVEVALLLGAFAFLLAMTPVKVLVWIFG